MIYGKVADRLSQLGYAVTPLKGKIPVIKDWESTTPETVSKDSRFNNFNIGLLCGEVSGVVVVDIDTFDEELEKKLLMIMPETPLMKKGNKGINFIYGYDGSIPRRIKIHNPRDRRKVELEFISGGGQTVIPRSIHPDTKKQYYWCDREGNKVDKHLLNVDRKELPVLNVEFVEQCRKVINDHFSNKIKEGGLSGMMSASDTYTSHKDLDDYAPKSLNEIPESYRDRCRSGSHDYLYGVMAAMVSKGRPKEEVIKEALTKDAAYNVGYASNYFSCRTCKYRGGSPYEKAEYLYESAYKTMVYKKEEKGEEKPAIMEVVESESLKEMEAVHIMLKKFGIQYDFESGKIVDKTTVNLMKEGKKDLFLYDGRIWHHCKQGFVDMLYREFNKLFGYKKSHNAITAGLNKFISYIPSIPQDKSFWEQSRFITNFLNGTLVVENYELKFREHRRTDYLTNLVHYDYREDYQLNNEFMAMLDRMFEFDDDRDDKIFAIQEMYGNCLMPCYPRAFFPHGVSGSGKSTICKMIKMLLDKDGDNFSSVGPSDMSGFNLETMVNKTVNMDMDIDSSRPINEAVFKKIEDAGKVRINRKGIEDIYGHLPLTHIFAANNLPKNFDGSSGAYERRCTFIPFTRSYTSENKNYNKNFAEDCFASNPEGILAFSIQGLKRILENRGHFTTPRSGAESLKEWVTDSDLIAQFIEDIENNEVEGITANPVMNEEGRASRKEMWEIFRLWKKTVDKGHVRMGKNMFYKLFENKGFEAYKTNGSWYFKGVEIPEVEQNY
jgi:phage/plasmid-associated DNA primase